MRRVRQITIKYLAVFAVLLFFAGAAGCGSKKSSQMFTYTEKEDGTLEITGLTDGAREQSSFAVPAQIDGKNVTSVAREAFRDCANMKEIVLPEGIVSIGENAFLSCYNLESITFPSSVETVGTNVVKNTAWEKKEFEQSGAVIINNILAAVQNVSGEYTVPDGVVKIASGVFYGNTELTERQAKWVLIFAQFGVTAVWFSTAGAHRLACWSPECKAFCVAFLTCFVLVPLSRPVPCTRLSSPCSTPRGLCIAFAPGQS